MGLLPDIQARCRQHKWAFQQDGAPVHTVRNTTDYLKKEKIDFITPDMWPTNIPDLNPVDYAVWGTIQQRVYHGQTFNTVEEVKRVITTECKNCCNVLLTIALMSGVVILSVLLRIMVDMSNNVISLKYSRVLSFSYFSYF